MSPARARGDSKATGTAQSFDQLERGRRSYEARAWLDAYELLSRADEAAPLGAEDLELLATSAYMLGRDADYLSILERAHHVHLTAGGTLRAARCAGWIGMTLAVRGEVGGATGWLGRAQRLVERDGHDCAEQGYMLLPVMFQHEAAGDYAAAAATAAAAAETGQRFGDADLFALAVHAQGQMLIKDGQVKEGLGLLDEAMVAVTTGELSPIPTGLVYCGVILACQEVYELSRARDWTAALTRWCADQPDLVAFTGRCLVHRAEIMQLDGAWSDALDEARRAGLRFLETMNPNAGVAFYRQGELFRLRGEFGAAEEAYREASRCGWEPQPGLAQLRLAQGRSDVAAAAIRRAAGEVSERLKRAGLLAAYVEIMLAVDDRESARVACRELVARGAGLLVFACDQHDLDIGRQETRALQRLGDLADRSPDRRHRNVDPPLGKPQLGQPGLRLPAASARPSIRLLGRLEVPLQAEQLSLAVKSQARGRVHRLLEPATGTACLFESVRPGTPQLHDLGPVDETAAGEGHDVRLLVAPPCQGCRPLAGPAHLVDLLASHDHAAIHKSGRDR